MPLLPIEIPSGFFRNQTQYQAKNRWYNGNLVRFSESRLRPIGGWTRLAPTQFIKQGGVYTLKITNAGSGYVGNGTLTATGGGGSSFAGTYVSTGGVITSVTVTENGTGYTTLPTIVLTPASGSAGSGAVITPTLHSGVDPIRGMHSWRLSTGVRYLAAGSTQSLRIWDGSQSAGTNAPIFNCSPSSSPSGALGFNRQEDFQISGLGFGAMEFGGDLGLRNYPSSTATFTASSSSGLLITSNAHGLLDTTRVQVSTTGTLPTGLSADTNYYVVSKTTNTFKLALTEGGSAIAYTNAGSPTHSWITEVGITSGGDLFSGPRYPSVDPDVQDPSAFHDNFCPTWSLCNFCDDLLACHTGEGTIWYWDASGASFSNANQTVTAPVALQTLSGSTGVPTGSNVAVLVTPERHIMILGAGGAQRKIQWGSQESLTDFTPSLTNTAGDLEIQTKGRIIGGFTTRYGVLIFTTSDVWRTNFLGPPYQYGLERLTEGAAPIGPKCIAGSGDFCAWISRGRFWSYSGGYIKELSCSVADYIFSDYNYDVEGLICAAHNSEWGEIWWFYPQEGKSNCTRYAIYSYREEHWTTGELERTAAESSDALGYPVWAGSDGYLYRHEMDPDTQSKPIPRDVTVAAPADVAALSTIQNRVMAKGITSDHPNIGDEAHLCFAESGAIEIDSGNNLMAVNQILTDTDAGTGGGLRMEVTSGKTPDAPGTTHGPFPLEGDGYTDCRFTDRQTFLRVESPFDQDWRFGEVRFEANKAGRR